MWMILFETAMLLPIPSKSKYRIGSEFLIKKNEDINYYIYIYIYLEYRISSVELCIMICSSECHSNSDCLYANRSHRNPLFFSPQRYSALLAKDISKIIIRLINTYENDFFLPLLNYRNKSIFVLYVTIFESHIIPYPHEKLYLVTFSF
jgi:hypothetical protein